VILSSRAISEDVFYSAVFSDSPEMRRLFDGVTEVLSDHPLMVKQEAHFRLQSARRGEAAVADRAESVRGDTAKTEKQSVKFAEVSPETKKSLPQRTC
jgi:hypothetical protein